MPQRFLRLPEVKLRVGLSRSSIYFRKEQGTFPNSVRLGENSVAWREEDIDRWMAARAEAGLVNPQPESSAEMQRVAPPSEHRVDAAVGPIARAGRRGFAARRPGTTALASTQDGRR